MSFYDSFTLKSVPAAGAQAKDGESLDLVSSLANIRNEFSEAKGDGQGGWAQAKDSGRDFDGSQAKGSGGGDSDAQSKEAKRVQRACSSSTSSLYVRSTLQVPDVDHLLVSIAMLLEQLIQPKVLDFDMFSRHIPPSIAKVNMHVIYSFMKEAFIIAQWSPECNIIAMVLISRMCASTDVSLNLNNWDKILLCALLVAQKIWDDVALSNNDFPLLWQQAFPGNTGLEINLADVNRMERTFLEVMHYDVNVTRSTYTQFYFELNALTASLGAPKKTAVQSKLSVRDAEMLEMRSATFTSQIMSLHDKKKAVAQGSKSATLGTASPSKRPMIIN
jgi:hypothetical protein